jgi:hypothetical protein
MCSVFDIPNTMLSLVGMIHAKSIKLFLIGKAACLVYSQNTCKRRSILENTITNADCCMIYIYIYINEVLSARFQAYGTNYTLIYGLFNHMLVFFNLKQRTIVILIFFFY